MSAPIVPQPPPAAGTTPAPTVTPVPPIASDGVLVCPAPAKLNLFLHVTGRRADGYHELQSAFTLIDLHDTLRFVPRHDGRIVRIDPLPDVPPDTDLAMRAAHLLASAARSLGRGVPGVDIGIDKRIPMGGGLGGGSSDAATTLIALNRLWGLGLARERLMELGLKLGADVPFFVFGRSAFAEGVGERLSPIDLPDCWYALIHPGVHVPTAAIFGAPDLTRNTKAIKISDFSATSDRSAASMSAAGPLLGPLCGPLFGHNDLEAVAAARFAPVAQALQWMRRFVQHADAARMTGSGACVFGRFADARVAQDAVRGLPEGWSGWVCRSQARHPLYDWLDDWLDAPA